MTTFVKTKKSIMKKIIVISLFSASFLFAALFIFNPQTATGAIKSSPVAPGTELPDSIMKFVQKTCMDCHADDGSSIAKMKVNFSKWSEYDADKQIKKANAICKELTKSSMPPKKWRANNPDNVPTPAQIDMICRWAKGIVK